MLATGIRAAALLFVAMALSHEVCNARPACKTERPIIGIVAQGLFDSNPVVKHYPWTKGKSYIPASYVKLAESSGESNIQGVAKNCASFVWLLWRSCRLGFLGIYTVV